jgi:glycine/D-amino acid oxidase-like deaminating enzyme
VVGAGYTGLAVARTWAEARPDASVALLEASIVGESTSGRNCGFLLEAAPAAWADPGAAERIAERDALLRETMQWLRDLMAVQPIWRGLSPTGIYRVAVERDRAAIERLRAGLEAAGRAFELLDADELGRRLGTRFYSTGLFSPDGALVQPAALVRGLADSLPGNVTLYEETPVVAIGPEGGGWRLECPDGSLLARCLVLANNAFVPRLGIGGGRLVARYAYAGLTAPLSGTQLAGLGRAEQWGLLPVRPNGVVLRRTGDGRLLVCSFRGYACEEDNGRVVEHLRLSLARRFPQLGVEHWSRPFEHVWSGTTGFTRNGAPLWGELRRGLFVSAGCGGEGAVQATLLGRLLARHALGDAVPDVGALFGQPARTPPESWLHLGFTLRSAWGRRGRDDDA